MLKKMLFTFSAKSERKILEIYLKFLWYFLITFLRTLPRILYHFLKFLLKCISKFPHRNLNEISHNVSRNFIKFVESFPKLSSIFSLKCEHFILHKKNLLGM